MERVAPLIETLHCVAYFSEEKQELDPVNEQTYEESYQEAMWRYLFCTDEGNRTD